MIKIGISSSFMYPDLNRIVYGPKSLSYIENDMARYVARKGILPVLIPDLKDELLFDILAEMDGFVLQGGVDLAPGTYNEDPIGRWKGDRYRDVYELKILDYAITHSKPLLGICRGFQLMNAYFGGTLYQDTCTQKTGVNEHRDAQQYDTMKHPVKFVEGSFLSKLYAEEKDPFVNTVHHQAVKDLGNDLEVYAHSDDGLIEAFGYKNEPAGKVMGVQWHPEFSPTLGNEIIDEDILFEAFLKHVKSST
ncbi:MAG: gamma-glutamyl-gamma-aminobutyrate hydrolase family protein [Aureispira sp.]|nr:gamma-glutamyl-gamma-aminobutyrate hydrolase family protein [Aureispira sp.]